MIRRAGLLVTSALFTMWTGWTLYASQGAPAPVPGVRAAAPADPDVAATVSRYCLACHNAQVQTAGLSLEDLDAADPGSHAAIWEKVVRKLQTRTMPPAGMPRPDDATYDALLATLETALDRSADARSNPGRPALHRLNRVEYANAIRDLLHLEIDPEALLPPDDSLGGFDNNADILGLSPALLERYLAAAAQISALAVGSSDIGPSSHTYRVRGDASQTQHVEGLPLGTRGGVLARHRFPLDGDYEIQVKLLETNLGSLRGLEHAHDLEIVIDGARVHVGRVGGDDDYVATPVNATAAAEAVEARLRARVRVEAGTRELGAAFVHQSSAQGGWRLQPFLRSTLIATDHLGVPHVKSLTIAGPFEATGPGDTASRRRIFTCQPAGGGDERRCATEILSTLVRRAYRRPGTPDEIARLLDLAGFREWAGGAAGRASDREAFERGIERALRAVLANPKFLYRVEEEPAGVAGGEAFALGDLELASRLSFFLWSSIPDDDLLEVAIAGRLREGDTLRDQVRRMLADPRASALVSNFAGQWLHLRNLRTAEPDKNAFPNFDDNLRRAFATEADLFVGSIIADDRSALDLLRADDTFVNERLARHYGIPHVYGSHFRRVTLTDARRHGLLGKGAVLLVTSHADRTSPVVRGQWVLSNLLGTPPPPPPPDVDTSLGEEARGATPLTMRQRLDAHRASPQCASCHRLMDPLGFALEHFDAVGAWRTEDAGQPIDATGQLADGSPVDGVQALRDALLARPDVFVTTLTEKLLAYALGRALGPDDMPVVRAIVREAAAADYRFSAIVHGVVESQPFRMRRAAESRVAGL